MHVRSQAATTLFLNNGLATASHREVAKAVAASRHTLQLLNIERLALESVYAKRSSLQNSTLWHEYITRWSAFPENERAAFLEDAGK